MWSSEVKSAAGAVASDGVQVGQQVTAQRAGGPRTLMRYGRWTLEVRGEEVADITYDGVLLLRAIRPVVRDRDWNTLPARVLAPTAGGGTAATVALRFEDGDDIAFAVTLTVKLAAAELVVDFDGWAETAFQRNRIGLVVLHPAAEAGHEVTVRHTDGAITRDRWPKRISPHQPFTDIAGLAWTRDQVAAELELSGEVFENEDQRNWTDASFKTYSTPLHRPFPVSVAVGERVRQQARLQVTDLATAPRSRVWNRDVVTVGTSVVGDLPTLSLGAALYPAPVAADLGEGYDCVLVELADLEERWPTLLAAAAQQAAALGASLDVRVVTADPDAVARGVDLLRDLPVRRLAVFDPMSHLSTPSLWTALGHAVGQAGFPGELVGGTRAHFTELNRGQSILPNDLPALTFSLTPAMHATELPHLLDSLATQRTVAENATRIAAGRPVHVGPITLKRRFNAVATSGRPAPAIEAGRAVDPLQHTAFAAAWTLASIQALSVPGVVGLTYFETAGARGLLVPGRAAPTSPSPAGRVLGHVATAAGRPILDADVPDGLAALPLAGQDHHPAELLLANLTGQDRVVLVSWGDRTTAVPLAGWAVHRVDRG